MPQLPTPLPASPANRLPGAQIRRFTLQFPLHVWEKLYRRRYVRDNRVEIKAWALSAIVIFGAAGLFEYLALPEHRALALTVRFGLCEPWFTVTYWLAFHTRWRRYYGQMMLVSVTLAVWSSAFMYSQTPEGYRDLYLYQYLVAVLFLYLHMGMTFRVAAITGWLSCAIFFALALFNHALSTGVQDIWRGAVVVLSNVICMFSSYNHELAMRRYFRANQLMARQRTFERALQQQLSVVNRQEAIGRLAGGVAHEFNNLLQVISGNAQYVLAEPGIPEGLGAHLRMITKAAGSGAALTRQLLAFSRPQPQSHVRLSVDELVSQQIT
ncbi:MAG TPA: hypothetical protein VL359_12110, partial [bacterium]|nr:hypothetical protein [bacterium]